MLKKFIQLVGGDPNKREIEKLSQNVQEINALERRFEELSDEALRQQTAEFRRRIAEKIRGLETPEDIRKAEWAALDELLPEAYAAVREASKRTIGLRHYDVQLLGGMALHQGKIAEMRTGEGKTLVATLPVYLNALAGHGAHLITVNDYLARRDARWMAPVYQALGMSIGVLQMAARTENGKKAFVVDLTKESPHEDQHQLRMTARAEAYAADITYGTNSEFGFDYLRDNMTTRWEDRVQRGHFFAIVDEVDNVLIDEARTPLIISGPAADAAEWYVRMAQVVRALKPEDYEVSEKDRNVTLSEVGEGHVEELLDMPLRDPDRPEDVTPEQARLLGYLEQALRAQFLYHRNKEYVVQSGKIIIVDEFTGRMMPGRRWSDGLHQAVEAKEGVRVQNESVTYATITIQNYFRMYARLSGMSGTALTEAEEFFKIYKLGVLPIPTNLEYQASRPESGLAALEAKDDLGYKYSFYARKDDAHKTPVYWRRKDYPDVVYRSEEAKLRAITREIMHEHAMDRPLLVGTTSVELSERLSTRLRADWLRRLAQTMLLRDAWLRRDNAEEDGRAIAELNFLNGPLLELDTTAMRKLSRDLGISFTPEDPANLERLAELLSLPREYLPGLSAALQGGIQHQVLNARKHTEESQIIAGAGARGAVTIATNMAGRGVDIKLGGELPERAIANVNRILRRAGQRNPYDMTLVERRNALSKMQIAEFGLYESDVQAFMKYMADMEAVRALGGLHVIGSTRHEARRIDNQLRGRAARQGDPGSSRFYLSMEDELMRLFGGQQADNLMQRMKIDDSVPIEFGLVGRLVEQSQTRVEGSNFDMRKHLLEYDDVLNTQRAAIYTQRDRIFDKDDLTGDVDDMLHTELAQRVPESLKDSAGPWRLLAWLDGVQPTLPLNGRLYPAYAMRLLLDHVQAGLPKSDGQQALSGRLLEVAAQALDAEKAHLLDSVRTILEQAGERLQSQLDDRLDTLDNYLDGLTEGEGDEDQEPDRRRPAEILADLNETVHLQLRLPNDDLRRLKEDPEAVRDELQRQASLAVHAQAVARLLGAIKRYLGEAPDLTPAQLDPSDWKALSRLVMQAVEAYLDRRPARLLGTGGEITKELDEKLARRYVHIRLPNDLVRSVPLKDDGMIVGRAAGSDLVIDTAGISHRHLRVEYDGGQVFVRNLTTSNETFIGSERLAAEERRPWQAGEALRLVELRQERSRPEESRSGEAPMAEVQLRLVDEIPQQFILRLLIEMATARTIMFDKSHRSRTVRTARLNYRYFAAELIKGRDEDAVAADVLTHLEEALGHVQDDWGQGELNRLAMTRPLDLEPAARQDMAQALGVQLDDPLLAQPLRNLPLDRQPAVAHVLGRRVATRVYRTLLLHIITNFWSEYLTQMEGLRTAISLESYAQRDPLVQYKSRASELYKSLLRDIRLEVITRVFTYRPGGDQSSLQIGTVRSEALPAGAPADSKPAIETGAEEARLEVLPGGEAQADQPGDDDEAEGPASSGAAAGQDNRKKRKRHR